MSHDTIAYAIYVKFSWMLSLSLYYVNHSIRQNTTDGNPRFDAAFVLFHPYRAGVLVLAVNALIF